MKTEYQAVASSGVNQWSPLPPDGKTYRAEPGEATTQRQELPKSWYAAKTTKYTAKVWKNYDVKLASPSESPFPVRSKADTWEPHIAVEATSRSR